MSHSRTGWVDGSILNVFPTHPRTWGLSTYLCHLVLTPETGIVKGHIPMLVHCIDVSLVLQQLCRGPERKKAQSVLNEIFVSRHEERENSTHSP